MNDPKILWEQWQDPFAKSESDDIEDEVSYRDSYERAENERLPIYNPNKDKFVMTSLGLVPVSEYTRPSKLFNFWTGHTNFNISSGVCEIIQEVDGVELLDVFTRYRFRVSIGKMFKDSEVRTNIASAISKYLESINATQKQDGQ